MERAKMFDIVKVHYTGTLNDGTVFDSSEGRDPLQFVLGEDMLLAGFEQAVMGMVPGEAKNIKIASDQAYGPHNKDMVVDFKKSQFPPNIDPQVGYTIEIKDDAGEVIPAQIVNVTGDTVTLDANHPLAGQDLNFNIKLLEIVGQHQH